MNIRSAVLLSSLLLLPPLTGHSEQNESCEGAFAFGPEQLDDFLKTERWGWQITIEDGEEVETPIYAGAAQNDINKGTQVGKLHITYLNERVTASFFMFDGSVMSQTALYVGEEKISKAAPGQYGNNHEDLVSAGEDKYKIDVSSYSGSTVYVVAYAEVCFGSGSGPEVGSETGADCEKTDFSWSGRWSSGKTYLSGNMVQYDGSSYINICCTSNSGASPVEDAALQGGCWDLMVSRGDTGAQGEKGDTGDTGAQGLQGEKGDKGDTGETGAQGLQGEKGDKGDTGEAGAQGLPGEKGDKGDTGDAGAQGLPGEKGDKGDTGDAGAQG
ncbi:MAG: hypothetical protein WBM35_08380, partial [Candidatus Electrothrix sp.]